MTFPEIRLPEPEFTVEVDRPVTAHALRFLLWGVPSLGTETVMLARNGSTAGALTALAAGLVAFAIAVLLVNVRARAEGDPS